jgi:hypothetical protein
MTNTILGRLRSRRQVPINTVHLQLWTERHSIRIKGECRGMTIYNVKVEKILPIIIQSLKAAGYKGTWGAEDPPLTTQLLETIKSFDPIPKDPCCPKCQQPLKAGDRVISIEGKYRCSIYHESCYESTLH